MSTEAAQELGLAPGMLAVAVIKSTNVIVETVTRVVDTVITADTVPAEGEDA